MGTGLTSSGQGDQRVPGLRDGDDDLVHVFHYTLNLGFVHPEVVPESALVRLRNDQGQGGGVVHILTGHAH
jgi:hypothetical protein